METEATVTPAAEMQIRWMLRKDMPSVLDIERASFEHAWTEEDFLNCLRQKTCIGMVVEDFPEVAGFMIYGLHRHRLRILNMAVDPARRRRGVGRMMVDRLKAKLSQQRRTTIATTVRETDMDALRFFRSQGCLATDVIRGHYQDTGEDGIEMEWTLPEGQRP